jgi:hypothetical protein
MVKKASGFDLADFVADLCPGLAHHAATLQPFADVISGWGCCEGGDCFDIYIDCSRVWASGDYDKFGADVYADRVVMYMDTHSGDDVFREEYVTDMRGLWDFLRQLPRPMHSFERR